MKAFPDKFFTIRSDAPFMTLSWSSPLKPCKRAISLAPELGPRKDYRGHTCNLVAEHFVDKRAFPKYNRNRRQLSVPGNTNMQPSTPGCLGRHRQYLGKNVVPAPCSQTRLDYELNISALSQRRCWISRQRVQRHVGGATWGWKTE